LGAWLCFTSSPLASAPQGSERKEIEFQAFTACLHFGATRKPARSGWISSPAGQRVHEHAETGKPQAAFKLHGARRRIEAYLASFPGVVRPCLRRGWNGPAPRNRQIAGSKLPP
jgi:hypothetical protein